MSNVATAIGNDNTATELPQDEDDLYAFVDEAAVQRNIAYILNQDPHFPRMRMTLRRSLVEMGQETERYPLERSDLTAWLHDVLECDGIILDEDEDALCRAAVRAGDLRVMRALAAKIIRTHGFYGALGDLSDAWHARRRAEETLAAAAE